ncbi:MAG: hypothetical protein IJK26_09035 [Clostridia bacterium]|nr:hypothetical protein [Clostridia bacterium]
MAKKDFKFKPMSKHNRNLTVLYCFAAAVSLFYLKSILFTLIFSGLAVANYMLMQKSKENEALYAEKISEIEESIGDDLTEDEKRKLHRYVNSDGKDANSKKLQQMIDDLEAEDEKFYEEYARVIEKENEEGVEDEGAEETERLV